MAEVDPYAFSRGYYNHQNYLQGQRQERNQLAQQGVENERNRLRDMYLGEDRQRQQVLQEREDSQYADERKIQQLRMMNAAAAEVSQNPQAITRWGPQLEQAGMLSNAWQQMSPEELQSGAKQLYNSTTAALQAFSGKVPEQQSQWVDEQGPRGTVLQRNPVTGELRQVVAQAPQQPASQQGSYSVLSPEQTAAAGFPAGTVVQRNDATGQLDVVTKRDNTGALSQRDMTTAKLKLQTLKLARQQLEKVKERFAEIKGSVSAGAFGQGRLPSEGGRAFDAAIDQMRSTLTALTRVPGVGAMSDYETKLDQAKFPDRKNYEAVTEQQIQGLEDMLATIETGYTNMLGNQGDQVQQEQGPVRVNTPADAAKLPPGTRFITPDGQERVRR